MANQGILAQLKPSAATDTVLYSAKIDESVSAVLTIANDGTGSTYDVAIKDYDQKLAVDASTYLLHPGDIVTGYKIGGKRGVAFIDGVMPRASFNGKSLTKFGTGRFDPKSGFALGLKPANILGNQENNSSDGVCTQKATNNGSGGNKSTERKIPREKLAEIGINAFALAASGEFEDPIISDADTFNLGNGTFFELE